jgi:hypothetical protein
MKQTVNYGFVKPDIVLEGDKAHFVLGSSALPKVVLRADRDWKPLAPTFEPQLKQFETYNCTAFATIKCVQMYMRALGLTVENYSDRWVGIIAGTLPPGNDPHKVAEAIRKHGLIPEAMLPFSEALSNVEEYYSFKGADEKACRKAGQDWLIKFGFGHEWVFQGGKDKQAKMLEALQYSPLGVSVYAWEKQNGLFVKPSWADDNHWTECVLVDYVKNKYWVIFDTYLDDGEPYKKLTWDYDFGYAKRYHIEVLKSSKKKLSLFEIILWWWNEIMK